MKSIYMSGVPGQALVKTDRGDVPIRFVEDSDLLWDGKGWVPHDGVISLGYIACIEHDGVCGTEGLFVYTDVRPLPIMLSAVKRRGYKIPRIDESIRPLKLKKSFEMLQVYEILNAGPDHRFTCQGVLVHNMMA